MTIQDNTVQVDSKIASLDGARFARSSGAGRVTRQPSRETLGIPGQVSQPGEAGRGSRSEAAGLPVSSGEAVRDGFSPEATVEPAGEDERDIHPLLASLRGEGSQASSPAERPAPANEGTRALMTEGLDALKGSLRVARRLGPRDAFASGKHDRGLATAPLASRAPWHEYSDAARHIPPCISTARSP